MLSKACLSGEKKKSKGVKMHDEYENQICRALDKSLGVLILTWPMISSLTSQAEANYWSISY